MTALREQCRREANKFGSEERHTIKTRGETILDHDVSAGAEAGLLRMCSGR